MNIPEAWWIFWFRFIWTTIHFFSCSTNWFLKKEYQVKHFTFFIAFTLFVKLPIDIGKHPQLSSIFASWCLVLQSTTFSLFWHFLSLRGNPMKESVISTSLIILRSNSPSPDNFTGSKQSCKEASLSSCELLN